MTIPTLYTHRLILRPYRRADFDAYAALLASPRADHMDGPHDPPVAWAWFTNDIASWGLYGFGHLAVEHQGRLAGFVGASQPPQFPLPEFGWCLMGHAEGQGIAFEAARALLAHVFATTPMTSIVSNIGPENSRSIALAERLGAVPDPDAPRPEGDDCIVYRHSRKDGA